MDKELEDARVTLAAYQRWRRGEDERTMTDAGIDPRAIGLALDVVLAALPRLARAVSSLEARLAKCQVQRERFHAQLRTR